MPVNADQAESSSGGLGLEFSGFVAGEIGGGGAVETVLAVYGGVDLVTRKNEPIFGRLILDASHFTEFQEGGRFLHGGFVCRFARGLELLEDGQVFLEASIDALLIESEELELLTKGACLRQSIAGIRPDRSSED